MTKVNLIRILSFLFSVILILPLPSTKAQSVNTELFQYLSPVPGAKMIMPSSRVLIRYGKSFSSLTPENLSDINVIGEKSGNHTGKLTLVENNEVLSFIPSSPFEYGERVIVELKNKFKLISGSYVPYLKYNFTVAEKRLKIPEDPNYFLKSELGSGQNIKRTTNESLNILTDSLPADFPNLTVNYYNAPTSGFLFYTPFNYLSYIYSYLIISDNHGIPVFFRRMGGVTLDFKKQPNGNLTYFYTTDRKFYVMNSSYDIIDTLTMQNGYVPDPHELRILENGHVLMFCYDRQPVRMDTVVAGGNPNAIVTGLVLQELDNNNNLVFQWRSWDHFKITDATYDINLTDSLIDYVHANAIETDYDGNILLSCRHMDEITKINRITGDIIWRWGGKYCKHNQFMFLNDSTGFSHQHHIRRLSNGNYTLFDNGNLHNPEYSRAAEYQMDDINKWVTLVWQYEENPPSYSFAMGSVQRLPNHNTLIGWGWNSVVPSDDITEVSPDGVKRLSLSLPDTMNSYRSFKFAWDTEFFTSDKDTLQFGVVPVGNSGTLSFNLTNNSGQTVEINSVYNRNSAYTFQQQLPVVISPQSSVNFSVEFSPDTGGIYIDDLHLRWETEGQRIAKVIPLSGYTDSTYLGIDGNYIPTSFSLSQNYPNPFNPVSRISYSLPYPSLVKLKVFDLLGNEIATLVNEEQSAGNHEIEFNGSNLASGIYFYRIIASDYTAVKKMLLLK